MNQREKRSAAAVLFATYICMEVIFVAGSVSGPTWQAVFRLSNAQLGMALGAAQIGILIASLLAGRITDRHGPVRILSIAVSGILVSLAVLASAVGFPMLLLGLAGFGVGAALTANAGVTLLSVVFAGRMRRVMALASALWFGSSLVSGPVIGYWLDRSALAGWTSWGFRLPFGVMVVLLAGCLFAIRRRFGGEDRHRTAGSDVAEAEAEPDASVAPASREWMWIPFLGLCHGMLIITLIAWLNPMAQRVFGVSDFYGGLLFGVAALGVGSGRLLLAALSGRSSWDDRVILALSGSLGAVFLTIALMAPTFRLAFALTGLGAFCSSATAPCLFSLVADRFPAVRARLYGYMEASMAAAATGGTFFVGLLSDHGVPLRLAMGVSPLAASLLAAGALVWRHRSPAMPLPGSRAPRATRAPRQPRAPR